MVETTMELSSWLRKQFADNQPYDDFVRGIVTARGLRSVENRTRVTIGGVVTHRQRPATATPQPERERR